MREEDLRVLFQRVPSPLLRLHMSSGVLFEIQDPDSVHMERSTLQILLPPQHQQP
jgi:hypothetical protein